MQIQRNGKKGAAFEMKGNFETSEQRFNIIDKIWQKHVIRHISGGPDILYIDLHLVHEVTSPQAFDVLRKRNLKVHQLSKTYATIDHAVPTLGETQPVNSRMRFADELARAQIEQLERNCAEFDLTLFDLENPQQGIVHVIGPELGLTQPGMTVVCGDSHTATHGALGCLAFGIGTTEVSYVLATQCLLQNKPLTCKVHVDGQLADGATAKDMILLIIQQLGVDGGVGYAFEYTGEAIEGIDMEGRMTICNMSIEAGARSGIIAPDYKTFKYLKGRRFAPQQNWSRAVNYWESIKSDPEASYDKTVTINISRLEPMITYGTNPSMSIPINGVIPDDSCFTTQPQKESFQKALQYMGFQPGEQLLGKSVHTVFIGSCTNARLSDLQAAAEIFRNQHVAENVSVLVVPGSQQVKRQAEALGLDRIFQSAGAEWREPGCSMCIAMNGDQVKPGQYAVSTSNRNFEGRQGKNSRTLLASPLTAAACAITGRISDPRPLLQRK